MNSGLTICCTPTAYLGSQEKVLEVSGTLTLHSSVAVGASQGPEAISFRCWEKVLCLLTGAHTRVNLVSSPKPGWGVGGAGGPWQIG